MGAVGGWVGADHLHGRRWLKHYANRVFKAAKMHAQERSPGRIVVSPEDLVQVGGSDPFRNQVRLVAGARRRDGGLACI